MRTLTEILTDELDAANPIIEPDFDAMDEDVLVQYCELMEAEYAEAA